MPQSPPAAEKRNTPMLVIHQENVWETYPYYQLSNLIFDYSLRYTDRNMKLKDYGTGELYSPVEAHLLEKIFFNPGITVTDLAKKSNRSKGAISQVVTKLIEKGLVIKTSQEFHKKRMSLWATPKGKQLTKAHLKYDDEKTGEFFKQLLEHYTSEQIDAFFKVMESCLYLLHDDYESALMQNLPNPLK